MQNPPESKNATEKTSADKKRSFKEAARTMLYRAGIGVTILLGAAAMVVKGKIEYDMDKAMHKRIQQHHIQQQLSHERDNGSRDEGVEALFQQNNVDWQTWIDTTGLVAVESNISLTL